MFHPTRAAMRRSVIGKDGGSHWNPDLECWVEQGVDTPAMVLIKVHDTRIHCWDSEARRGQTLTGG